MMDQQGQMEQQGEGQGNIGKLVSNVGAGLSMLAELASKSEGADPQISQRFAALVEEYTSLIEQLSGGMPEEGQQQPVQGTTSPEQGANPNARPAY